MFKNLLYFVSFLVVSTYARALKSGICKLRPSSNIALRMLLPTMCLYVDLMAKVFLTFHSCGQYLTIAKVRPFSSPAYHPATFWKVQATEEEPDIFTVSPIVRDDKFLSFANYNAHPGNDVVVAPGDPYYPALQWRSRTVFLEIPTLVKTFVSLGFDRYTGKVEAARAEQDNPTQLWIFERLDCLVDTEEETSQEGTKLAVESKQADRFRRKTKRDMRTKTEQRVLSSHLPELLAGIRIQTAPLSRQKFLTRTNVEPSPKLTRLPGRALPPSNRANRVPTTPTLTPKPTTRTPPPRTPLPRIPPVRNSPSDSDSDDDMMAATSSFASHKGEARVTAGTSSKNCPKVSAGDVTHGTLHRFLTAAQNWRTTYHPTVAESAIMPYLAPGFCDNARLDDFYYQNSDCYNKYTPTEFRTAARKRFFSTTWYLDVRRKLDSLQQGDGSFADFHDAVLTQNRYLEGNPEHIKDALLVSTLKKGMHVDLSERCSEPDTEIAKMFSAIANGTADSSKDETVAHWVKLVEVEDEKLRRERIRNQRDARNAVNDLGLKRMHNNAFQSNATVAAPVHSLPASIPSYLGPNNYANPSANVGALRPANQYASLGPSNQFGSRSYIQNSHLAPRYNENERWIMFFLAHFCINCRLPFQNHRKNDNVCDPCLAANYEIRDVNFINRWVQAHPNGFENRRVPNHGIAARQPRIITTEDVVRAVERVQANGGLVPPFFLNLAQNHASNPSSSSNSIPLGPSNHVAPLQSIPQNYVAPILHSHAFPPRISSRDNVRDSLDKRTSS
ncbi:hypothetical protein IW262DRAFT_1293657 [Armillaria fumosa]|nr:hypothetical protein IW262DRAFT_1293657 [Armillaria fumosa]